MSVNHVFCIALENKNALNSFILLSFKDSEKSADSIQCSVPAKPPFSKTFSFYLRFSLAHLNFCYFLSIFNILKKLLFPKLLWF